MSPRMLLRIWINNRLLIKVALWGNLYVFFIEKESEILYENGIHQKAG